MTKRALELHSTGIIRFRNHPSGDPTSSREDVETMPEIRKVAAVLDIVAHDHVIVGDGRSFSFRREGIL